MRVIKSMSSLERTSWNELKNLCNLYGISNYYYKKYHKQNDKIPIIIKLRKHMREIEMFQNFR